MALPLPLHKQFHPGTGVAAGHGAGELAANEHGVDARGSAREQNPEERAATAAAPSTSPGGEERPRSSLTLRVGDLAKRTGKTVRALHLYEEHGLLAPAERSGGGYRLYTRESELRVRWIDKLQQMGFSLSDIKQIVRDVEHSKSAPRAMQRVQDLFQEKLAETREQLRRLSALEGELTQSLAYLVTCDSCESEELLGACISCARHECDHKAPELVAGFRVH
jgi:MerR family copper efflux transcriptional regulator